MVPKSKIEKKLRKKNNQELVRTIILLKKQKSKIWIDLANILSNPKRKNKGVNLYKINKLTKANDVIVVPWKILSDGELQHVLTISYFKISEASRKKLGKAKLITIEQLLSQNKEGKGVKIII